MDGYISLQRIVCIKNKKQDDTNMMCQYFYTCIYLKINESLCAYVYVCMDEKMNVTADK